MTKQKILKSAIKILDNHSFSNTTTRMIANEANIAVGSIYNHYKNKEDILNYLFESEYIKRVQYFNYLDNENLTNLNKLLAFVEFHFLELKLNESLAKVLIRESSNPDLANLEGIKKFNSELPSKISKIIINAKEANEIRDVDHKVVSNLIFNLIRSAVYTVSLQGLGNIESIKDEVKEFIKRSLRKGD